jgi:hypothetical protein
MSDPAVANGAARDRAVGASPARERVLLVCPPVFSYHLSIAAELKALGFDVTWWDDRGSTSSLYKAGLRLMPDTVAKQSQRSFQARLAQLEVEAVTRVLIVKGEGMSVDFLRLLRHRLPSATFSLYFWDSVDNARRAQVIAPLFDRVATFDPVDAASLGWTYRPLFARAESIVQPCIDEAAEYDWCFIGTIHSDRFRIVQRLRRANPDLRSFFFGFAPSRMLMAARHMSDWSLWKASRASISTRAMPADRVSAIARASRAMVDIEHPRQRGLTMRTIETLLSGRKLITTNQRVLDSDLFDPSRVQVISRESPQVPRMFLDTPFKPIEECVTSRYTLRRWISDLLGRPAASVSAVADPPTTHAL